MLSLLGYLQQGELIHDLASTLLRVLISFMLAMAIGVALGVVMGRHKHQDAALDGMLVFTLNLPALVTIILCYL